MVPDIEPLYRAITDIIIESVPEPWTTVKLDLAFFSEHIHSISEYLPEGGQEFKTFTPNMGLEIAFNNIRKLFKKAGKPLWGRVHFEMTHDGTFKINFDYNDLDENGFARFDEEQEKERADKRWKRT